MPATIPRRIFFYRMVIQPEEDGELRPFPVPEALAAISRLRFQPDTTTRSRYMVAGNGSYLGAWPRMGRGDHPRLCLGCTRRDGLPRVEELGEVTALRIREEQGLLEQTHIVFFPNHIVGAEFNFYGPRVNALANYFANKLPTYPKVKFAPLLSRDAQRQLAHMSDLRLLQLRVHRDSADILRLANEHLPGAISAAAETFDAPVVEVVFRPDPYSRDTLGQKAWRFLRHLIGTANAAHSADVVRAKGLDDRTGGVEWFDFLADKFVFFRRVAKEEGRQRAVDAADMYAKIEAVYNENDEQLRTAAAVGE